MCIPNRNAGAPKTPKGVIAAIDAPGVVPPGGENGTDDAPACQEQKWAPPPPGGGCGSGGCGCGGAAGGGGGAHFSCVY